MFLKVLLIKGYKTIFQLIPEEKSTQAGQHPALKGSKLLVTTMKDLMMVDSSTKTLTYSSSEEMPNFMQ